MTLKISCFVRSIGEYNEKFCSVIAKGQVVSIISSAGTSFHASSFPQLNCSARLCPFWWEMWRGSGVQLWQIRDYSNGFCHSLGIRFSLESIYFVSPVCTCDSHEWGHSAGRHLASKEQDWKHNVWKGARKQSSQFGISCFSPAQSNRAFYKHKCCLCLCYLLLGLLQEERVCDWKSFWNRVWLGEKTTFAQL